MKASDRVNKIAGATLAIVAAVLLVYTAFHPLPKPTKPDCDDGWTRDETSLCGR